MNDQTIHQQAVQRNRKDPWLAVFLSEVFPGAGHIYSDARGRGIFFITLTVALFLTFVLSGFGFLVADNAQNTHTYAVVFLAVALIMIVVNIYVYFDAYKVTKRFNPDETQTVTVIGARKPWLAAFLSALIPGIGQLYNRQIIKGLALPALLIATSVFENFYMPLVIVGFLLYVFGIKDAYDSAEKINDSSGRFFRQDKTILLFVLIMFGLQSIPYSKFIQENFVEAFKMPSGSMLPTMTIGDRFLLGKSRPFFTSPQRGDIVVFPYPEDPSKNFVKRVIGLGGDKIQIINGELYINDTQVASRLLGVETQNESLPLKGYGPPALYEERNGDAVYRVQYLRDNSTVNGGPWLVPQDAVFVMGDNRDNSQDSRVWGPVKSSSVKGKALKIYWSWDRGERKVRWERIGEIIR